MLIGYQWIGWAVVCIRTKLALDELANGKSLLQEDILFLKRARDLVILAQQGAKIFRGEPTQLTISEADEALSTYQLVYDSMMVGVPFGGGSNWVLDVLDQVCTEASRDRDTDDYRRLGAFFGAVQRLCDREGVRTWNTYGLCGLAA